MNFVNDKNNFLKIKSSLFSKINDFETKKKRDFIRSLLNSPKEIKK